jgi:hypothetical protein
MIARLHAKSFAGATAAGAFGSQTAPSRFDVWPTSKGIYMSKIQLKTMMAFLALVTSATFANAACSQQDAMAKGSELSQIVQTKMAQDPTAGQAMMMKMQPIMQANQAKMMSGGTIDWDAVCTEYDALIKQTR